MASGCYHIAVGRRGYRRTVRLCCLLAQKRIRPIFQPLVLRESVTKTQECAVTFDKIRASQWINSACLKTDLLQRAED